MNITFLDSNTISNLNELDLLKQLGEVQLYPNTTEAEVWDRIETAEVILTNKVRITEAHMRHAKQLKLICITATGMNNVDLDFAKQQGIAVKNVVGYARETVAQHTFAVLLHLLHHLEYYDHYVKSGGYSKSAIFTNLSREFFELQGKRMGIIGLGNIGKSVARIAAKGFGMEVVYHSPSGRNSNSEYQSLTLTELLETSDVVSIHSALNEYTQNLIHLERIKLMKSHAILVNMGRGGIVNEQDLAKALDEGLIRGACMDVFEKEPLPENHPYLHLKEKQRIVLTPHIAWAAVEARQTLMQSVLQSIKNYVKGTE